MSNFWILGYQKCLSMTKKDVQSCAEECLLAFSCTRRPHAASVPLCAGASLRCDEQFPLSAFTGSAYDPLQQHRVFLDLESLFVLFTSGILQFLAKCFTSVFKEIS